MLHCLHDMDQFVRKTAVQAFQKGLPPRIRPHLIDCLDDEDISARREAFKALGCQSQLSPDILHLLMKRLNHEYEQIRRETASALGSQLNLPLDILCSLARGLDQLESEGVKALYQQAPLPFEVLVFLVEMIEKEGSNHAADVLCIQPDLPPRIINMLVPVVQNKGGVISDRAIDTENLEKQQNVLQPPAAAAS